MSTGLGGPEPVEGPDRDPARRPADDPQSPFPEGAAREPAEVPEGPAAVPSEPVAAHGPPGAATFSIEGRAAPGLYWLGWILTIAGLGIVAVAALASSPGFATTLLFVAGLIAVGIGLVAGAGSQGIERRARGLAGYQGPSPFLVFAATVPWTVLLTAVVVLPLAGVLGDEAGPPATVVALLVTTLVYVGLIHLLVVDPRALGWAAMGVVRPSLSTARELLLGGLLAVPIMFLAGLLALVLSQFLALPEAVLPPTRDALGALLNLAAGAVIAPIAEEIFFRGFATTAWLRALGPSRAILRGAVFFAFVHVLTIGGDSFGEGIERAAFAFIVRLPVSLALCWIFVRRGTLSSAIGLHATYNAIPLLLAPFAPLPA